MREIFLSRIAFDRISDFYLRPVSPWFTVSLRSSLSLLPRLTGVEETSVGLRDLNRLFL